MKSSALSFFCLALILANEIALMIAQKHCIKGKGASESSIPKAIKFMMESDSVLREMSHEHQEAQYTYVTNLTDYNKNISSTKLHALNVFWRNATKEADEFDWHSFRTENETLYRWFSLFLEDTAIEVEEEDGFRSPRKMTEDKKETSLADIFNQARICPYKSKKGTKCTMTYEPDIKKVMSISRNPDELKYLWTEFRDKTGKLMRNTFSKQVKESNKRAEHEGFSDYGEKMMHVYEVGNFSRKMEKVLNDIMPLYKQLHAYIRRKLINYYKKVEILDNGPIPAHLLGDMYAQSWSYILDIVNPFSDKKVPNVTEELQRKKKKPIDLFIMAENFFASLDFPRMTPYFWAYSVMKKPTDREVVCHPTAYDLRTDIDFRIKMCSVVNNEYLNIVHHEMGHVEYYMLYKHLPSVFRIGANPGFHEAVGEVVTLSAMTYDYLKKVLFQHKEFDEDKDTDIIHLLDVALKYIPPAMYTFSVDAYRYNVYNGSIEESDLSRGWWDIRLKYQGVCPPKERTEKDFDPGAKYHIAFDMEYMRYFFANVLAFQMHKSLCKETGYSGPLHKCSIYENKAAGKLLKKVLSIGASKHWKEVMKILTKSETSELTTEAYKEYFKPLYDWLKKENKDEVIGWESDNPLICPSGSKKN